MSKDNDNKKINIFFILAVSFISLLAFLPINKANFPELSSEWMKHVEDTTKLNELSIPGTHDSGARHSIADVAGKCQDMSIADQLASGVRFWDIRLKLTNNKLVIVHDFVDQDLSFDNVIDNLVSFIESHDSETVIISIKEDASPSNSTISFDSALVQQLSNYKEIFSFDDKLPATFGEARGNIYIISRYSESSIGIPTYRGWKDSTTFVLNNFYIQDNYCVSTADAKIKDIENTLIYSSSKPEQLTLNFTSCYLYNGFPPLYAGTTAKQINVWLLEYLEEYEETCGVVISDYVTSELAPKIYERNLK